MNLLSSKFRKRVKLKNTFHKLILSYVLIISVILGISSISMYNAYKNQIIDQSSVISAKLMNQAEYYSEYTINWAISYMYQLYLNQDIYDLMFSGKNVDNKYGIFEKIKQTAFVHPAIQSVYIYNNMDKMVYPSDGKPTYYSLFDDDIKGILTQSKNTISTQFMPRKIKKTINGNVYEKYVLTLVMKNVDSSDTGLPYGAIILNLDAANVQNYFKNFNKDNYDILALNEKNRVILGSETSLFLEDVSQRDYVKKILNSKQKEGSFLATVNKRPSIVTFKTSDRIGLKFVNIIPYESLTSSINNMLRLVISTSTFLLLLGIALALPLFKKIYSPIDRTIKTIREYLRSSNAPENAAVIDSGEAANDTADLSKIVDFIIHQPLSINKLSSTDLNFIKKQLLSGLLFNTSFEMNNLKSKLVELDVNLEFKHLVVLLIKIDYYKNFEGDHTREECDNLKNLILTEAQTAIKNHFEFETVMTDEDELSIILSLKEAMNDKIRDDILEIAETVIKNIYEQTKVNISASLGDYVIDIENTNKSYKSAKEYMNYRLKYGHGSILYKRKIMDDISACSKYDGDVEDSIFRELRAGDLNKLEIELDKMLDIIKKMSYRDMLLAISRLMDNSQKALNNIIQFNGGNNFVDIEFAELTNELQTLDEFKEYLLALYKNTLEQLKEKKKNRKNEIIENILEYIHDNYAYPLLSPDLIAENMKLSPNYLRLLFKETEGKSISNYIKEVRFNKAKILLETTDLTVSEISAKVGFENDNYFYTAFKKYYGVSPSQYRNNLRK